MTQTAMFSPHRRDPKGLYSDDFELVWKLHPRGGKRTAFRAYLNAVPSKINLDELVKKLNEYVWDLKDGFRGAHLSTWLNGEHWESNLGGTGTSGYKPPKFYVDTAPPEGEVVPFRNPLKGDA